MPDWASVVLLHPFDLLHQLDLLHRHLGSEEVRLLLPEVGHGEGQAEIRQSWVESGAGVHVQAKVFRVVLEFAAKK